VLLALLQAAGQQQPENSDLPLGMRARGSAGADGSHRTLGPPLTIMPAAEKFRWRLRVAEDAVVGSNLAMAKISGKVAAVMPAPKTPQWASAKAQNVRFTHLTAFVPSPLL